MLVLGRMLTSALWWVTGVFVLSAESRVPWRAGRAGEYEPGSALLSAHGTMGTIPRGGVPAGARCCPTSYGAPCTKSESQLLTPSTRYNLTCHLWIKMSFFWSDQLSKTILKPVEIESILYNVFCTGKAVCWGFLLSWTSKTICTSISGTTVSCRGLFVLVVKCRVAVFKPVPAATRLKYYSQVWTYLIPIELAFSPATSALTVTSRWLTLSKAPATSCLFLRFQWNVQTLMAM